MAPGGTGPIAPTVAASCLFDASIRSCPSASEMPCFPAFVMPRRQSAKSFVKKSLPMRLMNGSKRLPACGAGRESSFHVSGHQETGLRHAREKQQMDAAGARRDAG